MHRMHGMWRVCYAARRRGGELGEALTEGRASITHAYYNIQYYAVPYVESIWSRGLILDLSWQDQFWTKHFLLLLETPNTAGGPQNITHTRT